MKTTLESISPEIAKLYLETNTGNRNRKDEWVDTLARIMLAGQFILNGDPIRFSLSGRLIDGQHRLAAIVKSGVTVQSLVVRGLQEDAHLFDDRASRTIQDTFQFHSVAHARVFGRAIQTIFKIKALQDETRKAFRPTTAEAIEFYRQNDRDLMRSFDTVGAVSKTILSRETLLAWHFLLSKSSPRADEFIEQLKTGLGLTPDSPVYILRKALIQDLASVRKLPADIKHALVIKAWNSFKSEEPIKILKFARKEQAFPKIS